MDKLHSLFLFVGTFAIKVISGGAYCKGLFHVKIIYNLYSGWIYSSSTTLLKTTWGINYSPPFIKLQPRVKSPLLQVTIHFKH